MKLAWASRLLATAFFIVVAMECVARGVHAYYGSEMHPPFSVNGGNKQDFYMINELGAMGFLRTSHDQVNVAVLGGSATYNNGFSRSWPALVGRALPNVHVDNFSETGPFPLNQLDTLKRMEARGIHYDLLFIEPPFSPATYRYTVAWYHNPWTQTPVSLGIGRWLFPQRLLKKQSFRNFVSLQLFFPSMWWEQAMHLVDLDANLARIGLLAKNEPFKESDRYQAYVAKYGEVRHRDSPDYFSEEDEKRYVEQVGAILEQAKRVSRRVVVMAPIIHYHAAPDGSDQTDFFKMIPTNAPGFFVSLKTVAETIWKENSHLKRLARQHGLAFYDGNQEFAKDPEHKRIFFDQFHLYWQSQIIIAARLLHLAGYDLNVKVQKGVHFRTSE